MNLFQEVSNMGLNFTRGKPELDAGLPHVIRQTDGEKMGKQLSSETSGFYAKIRHLLALCSRPVPRPKSVGL